MGSAPLSLDENTMNSIMINEMAMTEADENEKRDAQMEKEKEYDLKHPEKTK